MGALRWRQSCGLQLLFRALPGSIVPPQGAQDPWELPPRNQAKAAPSSQLMAWGMEEMAALTPPPRGEENLGLWPSADDAALCSPQGRGWGSGLLQAQVPLKVFPQIWQK